MGPILSPKGWKFPCNHPKMQGRAPRVGYDHLPGTQTSFLYSLLGQSDTQHKPLLYKCSRKYPLTKCEPLPRVFARVWKYHFGRMLQNKNKKLYYLILLSPVLSTLRIQNHAHAFHRLSVHAGPALQLLGGIEYGPFLLGTEPVRSSWVIQWLRILQWPWLLGRGLHLETP